MTPAPLASKYTRNQLYQMLSPSLKVAVSVLEQGLEESKGGGLRYSSVKGISWLSKLSRDLEGEVSRVTIDQSLDSLMDEGILDHGEEIMQKVNDVDGATKWVRAYHIGNEFVDKMLALYKSTHELKKAEK